MAVAKKKSAVVQRHEPPRISWPFGKINYILFGTALAVITVGYITLASGSITLSPILLVIGYCVLIPIAIIVRPHKGQAEVAESASTDQQL